MHPGSSLIGARSDLGLAVRWRFLFVPPGSTVSRGTDVLYLDVGGGLEAGVIDHHQGEPGATSAARLVFEHPGLVHEHLVGPWVALARTAELRGRGWSPTIGLHAAPDFDAIVSASLAMDLVEQGRFHPAARGLVEYADRVDQGAERPRLPEQRFELYPLILMLQNLPEDAGHCRRAGLPDTTPTREGLATLAGSDSTGPISAAAGDERMLRIGMHLVRRWLDARAPSAGRAAMPLAEDQVATQLAAALEADASRFVQARDRGRVRLTALKLPCIDRLAPPVEVPAAVLTRGGGETDDGTIACDKIYLRIGAAGLERPCPVTVIEKAAPAARDGNRRSRWSRWIIAIDEAAPPSDPASRANLRGLGASLEWAEQRARERLGIDEGARRGATRFREFPGIADPWYDGRGHGWTIVDTPRDGTVLEAEEIEAILRSRFWEPETTAAAAFAWPADGELRRTIQLPAASSDGHPCRIGDLVEAVQTSLRPAAGIGSIYALLTLHVRSGWDDAATLEALRDLLGGTPEPIRLSVGRAFVGPGACVVLLDREAERFEPDRAIDELFILLSTLDMIDAAAEQIGLAVGRDGAIGLCRRERERFARAAARYRGVPPGAAADARLLRGAIEETLHLAERSAATGQLIEHLHEESERSYEGRLSRIGFVLAAFVLAEVGIAACDAVVASGHLGGAEGEFATWWPVVAGGIYLLLLAMAISLLMHRLDHWWAARPILGPLLFPELQSHGTASPRAADSSPHRNRSHH